MSYKSDWAKGWLERRKTQDDFPSKPVITNIWLDELANAIMDDESNET